MTDSEFSDKKILQSWETNAAPWTRAIDTGEIVSRKLVTDAEIVAALLEHWPGSVLDIGCGEGWLGRVLAAHGVHVWGIDATAALVETARRRAGPLETYRQVSYTALESGYPGRHFDALACNFSLLGKESVEQVFASAPRLLKGRGRLVVQTLHPAAACGDAPYRDGWRPGSWAGFGSGFSDPAPWYFRTIASWVELFQRHGLKRVTLREPLHPETGQPASLILVGSRAS
ncbi:class I SAM-dependent methyltransferase [Microbulbifer sediminum]|uniref:class I SAM-dependent methyltransferase n=1 Tax=Microbulbifer sediminum TaxID=2904250 RepID=UPI001F2A09EE|nr:class I SAM-dependent methyltransferase [Microbulbifer sediminum]